MVSAFSTSALMLKILAVFPPCAFPAFTHATVSRSARDGVALSVDGLAVTTQTPDKLSTLGEETGQSVTFAVSTEHYNHSTNLRQIQGSHHLFG